MGISRRQLAKLGIALVGVGVVPRLGSTGELIEDGAPTADTKAMDGWWSDLEKDEPKSSRALLKFADKPADSVAYFQAKLKPLRLDKDRLKVLLTNLGSVDEGLWMPAFEELGWFDPRLATDLDTLMSEVLDTPGRQRMVCVLSGRPANQLDGLEVELKKFDTGHNFFAQGFGSWWAEVDLTLINSRGWGNVKTQWTRAVRAIALLEHIASPASIAVLKDLAGGHPLAQPTRAAAEALQRMGVKAE
jgi:hypothetical protein